MRLFLPTILITILFQGCAIPLTKGGARVRELKQDAPKNCKFIQVIEVSDTGGPTVSAKRKNVYNLARNKTHKLGGNAFKVNVSTTTELTVDMTAEVYKCRF
jgi:hypothetical protein